MRLLPRRRKPSTLRARFARRAALATLLLSILLGGALGVFWQARVREAVRDGVAGHLRALEAELDLAPVSLAPGTSPVILPAPEQFVQVVGSDGRVVATSSELAAAEPLVDIADLPQGTGAFERVVDDPRDPGSDALVMATQIDTSSGRYLGIVGASLERIAEGRRLLLWLVGVGAPGLALLIGAGVWMSVTYALRPVQAMAAEADRLAAGRGPWEIAVEPDTQELVVLSERLDELLAQIGEAFERERRFLDDASHELRTPIAVARTELDLARGVATEDLAVQEALRSSIQELDRLDRLAADLLVMARARGADRSTFVSCDLAGIARRAAAGVMRRPVRPGVNVAVGGSAMAVGDPQALERVVVNVVANAVDHARSRVEVSLSSTPQGPVIEVIDDGPGFPAEVLDRALVRFSRAAPDRSRGGTGLGLAIAAEIVAAHDGALEIHNLDGGGARVTVTLPKATPEPALGRNAREQPRPPSEGHAGHPAR